MYGLPKLHKSGQPLRPILSMTGAPQYNVSKWLCRLLDPVVQVYSTRCIKDSFAFVDLLKSSVPLTAAGYMCSFDVVSLFTNVPVEETIEICMKALYHSEISEQPPITEQSFRVLLRMVTTGVEFSFDDMMYRQVDGVAMGSPLGPILANIFVGYCESRVPETMWPSIYCRFVDDTFGFFENRRQSENLLKYLNSLHPSLKFTCEEEKDGRLAYMDVLVERLDNDGVATAVYRKPTFTGLYIPWDSFCATKYKINLVKNLVFRARRICSAARLDQELDSIKSIFVKNGYPVDLVSRLVGKKEEKEREFGPMKCPVYLKLPWQGQWSSQMGRAIACMAQSTYCAAKVNIVFSTVRAFNVKKDTLPTHQKSNLIYEFECRQCEGRYVGRTLQRLNSRIRQHVPLHLLTSEARALRPTRGRPRKATAEEENPKCEPVRKCPPRKCKKVTAAPALASRTVPPRGGDDYQSAIARHLAENNDCARRYDDDCFRVLCNARSKSHLEVLECLFIMCRQPSLCMQKQNVTSLKLFHAHTNSA